jgi:hypothetical protein
MTGDIDGEEPAEAVDWTELPSDPDLESDLGYELDELDVIETNNGSGQVLMLPNDEEDLREECFLVVQEASLVNLIDSC